MSNLAIDRGFGEQISAEFQPKVLKFSQAKKNSAKKYSRRVEFAQNFIHENSLSLSNYSKNPAYKLLSKNEKSAIRYQLSKSFKKKTTKRNTQIFKKETKKKNNIKIPAITIIPIIGVEYFVCTSATAFYRMASFNNGMDIVASVVIEAVYMMTAVIDAKWSKALTIGMLVYQIFTMSYSSMINDPSIAPKIAKLSIERRNLEAERLDLIADKKDIREDKKLIRSTQGEYNATKFLSRGINKLADDKKAANESKVIIDKRLKFINKRLENLNMELRKEKRITSKKIKNLSTESRALIFVMSLIQIFSACTIRGAIRSCRKLLKL